MTKEQEEAITRLEKLKNSNILYGDSLGITIEGFKSLQKDLEVVLNTINEKDAEIDKYKKLLAENLAKGLNDSIKAKSKAENDLYDFAKGCQEDLDKKDKIIDLMSKEINNLHVSLIEEYGDYKTQFSENGEELSSEKIKQYFERKAEESSSINKTQEKNQKIWRY